MKHNHNHNLITEAKAYLATPFAQEWLEKMKFTTRTDEFGNKFVFLAILCGYEQISDEDFQELCNAVCWAELGDELRMTMWIGGKVDWTMFYTRPDHVNGCETYFCGVVSKDDFGPEDWDRNHDLYSFDERGMDLRTKKYIATLPSMSTEELEIELEKKENGEYRNRFANTAIKAELANREPVQNPDSNSETENLDPECEPECVTEIIIDTDDKSVYQVMREERERREASISESEAEIENGTVEIEAEPLIEMYHVEYHDAQKYDPVIKRQTSLGIVAGVYNAIAFAAGICTNPPTIVNFSDHNSGIHSGILFTYLTEHEYVSYRDMLDDPGLLYLYHTIKAMVEIADEEMAEAMTEAAIA